MARGNVEVKIRSSFDDKGTRQAEGAMGRLNKAGKSSFGALTKHALGYSAALIGGAGVVGGLEAVVHASLDAEASQAKVRKALENAGLSWSTYGDRVDKALERQSLMTGFMKTDVQDAFANMIRTTGNVNEALKLNAVAMDIARTKGTGLVQAQSILARVYNGSFIGLKRLGIGIEPVTKAQDALSESTKKATIEQKRAAKEEDKRATVQKALALTQQKFAGQAKTYGATTAGSLDRMREAVNLLEVRLGKALAPTIQTVANSVGKFVLQMQSGQGAGGRFAKTVGDLRDNFEKLRPVLSAIGKGVGLLVDVFGFQVRVIIKLESALISLYRTIVDKILGAFSSMLDAIGAAAKAASHLPFIGGKFGKVGDAAHAAADKINNVRDALKGLDGKTVDVHINLHDAVFGGGGGGFAGINKPAPSKSRPRPRAGKSSVTARTSSAAAAGGPVAAASSKRFYSQSELRSLWIASGGPGGATADTAAAIAMAESGGDSQIVNSIGATGLWQIHPGGSQYLDPMANARAAVAKFRAAGGFSPWTTYTGADTGPGGTRGPQTYKQYLGRGGKPKKKSKGTYTYGLGYVPPGTNRVTFPEMSSPYTGPGKKQKIDWSPLLQASLDQIDLATQAGVNTPEAGNALKISVLQNALPYLSGNQLLQAQGMIRDLAPPGPPTGVSAVDTLLGDVGLHVRAGDESQAQGTADQIAILQDAIANPAKYGLSDHDILELRAELGDLTAALNDNTAQLQQQNEILQESLDNQTRIAATLGTELGASLKAVADLISGQIGGYPGYGGRALTAGAGSVYRS